MSILLTILIAVIVFALLWYLIGLIPLPAPLANAKWVLYAVLIIVAVIWLLKLVGVNLGL
jgi:hypothetical protein